MPILGYFKLERKSVLCDPFFTLMVTSEKRL